MKKNLPTLTLLFSLVLLSLLLQSTTANANPIPCCTFDAIRDSRDGSSPITLELSVLRTCLEIPSNEIAVVLHRNHEVIRDAEWERTEGGDEVLFRYVDSELSDGLYWYEVSANIGETPCGSEVGIVVSSETIPPPSPEGGVRPIDAGNEVQEAPADPDLRDGGQLQVTNRDRNETNDAGSKGCSISRSSCGNGLGAAAIVTSFICIIASRLRRKKVQAVQ